MRWTIKCPVLLAVIGGLLLSQGFAEVRLVAVEGAARVMLRSEPRIHPATALGSVAAGTLFPFQEEADGWLKVGLGDGSSAWLSGRYGRVFSAPGAAWIRTAFAPLLEAPEPGADLVGRFEAGKLVVVEEVEGAWARVRGAEDLSGWMRLESLEMLPGTPRPEEGLDVSLPPAAKGGEARSEALSGHLPEGETEAGEAGSLQQITPAPPAPELGETWERVAAEEPATATETETPEVHEGKAEEPVPGAAERGAAGVEQEVGASGRAEEAASERRLYFLIAAVLVVGAGILWGWRRRRLREVQRSLQAGGGTVRVRPAEVRRRLAEMRERRENLQRAVGEKFQELKDLAASELATEGPRALSRRLTELGKLAEHYEHRTETLSDLLALQSEMIDVLKEENELLRKAGGR